MGQGPTCIWSQRPPSIQVYKVQSASVTARRTVDDDLDNFGKYFYYNVRPVEHDRDYLSNHGADDFYSDVRPFEVKHDFDFCKLDGAETVNYDLERHIRRYSSSKLRKMRKMHSSRSVS